MSAATTIGATLAALAQADPQRVAIVCDEMRVTRRRFAGHALTQAQMIDAGSRSDAGHALLLPNSPLMLAQFHAVAMAGREAQVLDPDWPPALIDAALADLAPEAVYAADTQVVEDAWIPALAREPGDPDDFFWRVDPPDPDSAFYVGFTSGSTGRPKGYRRSHRSWIESFRADAVEFGIGEDDVVSAPGAMTHSLFLYAACHALHVGARLVMSRRFRPDSALAAAAREKGSVVYAAPTQLKMMIDAAGGAALPDVRLVLSSGAKWFAETNAPLARLFPNARLVEFYGASELSFVAVRKPEEDAPQDSVGRAFHGVRIAIRDETGAEATPGRAGRVFVESPYLFMGYATPGEGVARHGGEMCVGDVGFLDARGFLHLVGRERRMIVTSGKNVFPEEIERVLETHPAVAAAAAFGAPDARRGERLVALVNLRADIPATRRDLVAHLRARLPLPLVPRLFATPDAWPLTGSGKTDHRALRAAFDAGRCAWLR